jgi:hypothetical protein
VTNRITRYFSDLDALLDGDAAPVVLEQPLSLWIGRDVLSAVVEDNLANIRRNRMGRPETDDERRCNDAIEAERVRVLDWLRSRRAAHLFGSVTLIASVNEQAESEASREHRGDGVDSSDEAVG